MKGGPFGDNFVREKSPTMPKKLKGEVKLRRYTQDIIKKMKEENETQNNSGKYMKKEKGVSIILIFDVNTFDTLPMCLSEVILLADSVKTYYIVMQILNS